MAKGNIIKTFYNLNQYYEIPCYTKDTLDRPYHPSTWISKEPEYIDVTLIHMTCGGGMGGAQWTEYVERIPNEYIVAKNDKFVAKRIDGEEIVINPKYIVYASNAYQVMHTEFNNQNDNFELGKMEMYHLVKNGHKVTLN